MSQNAWQEVLTYEHDLIVRGLALMKTELDNLEAGKAAAGSFSSSIRRSTMKKGSLSAHWKS